MKPQHYSYGVRIGDTVCPDGWPNEHGTVLAVDYRAGLVTVKWPDGSRVVDKIDDVTVLA